MTGEQMPVGIIVEVDGVKKRHLGGGLFEPVDASMFKRFDSSECVPIGRQVTNATQSGKV